jgi:hypothetical protein
MVAHYLLASNRTRTVCVAGAGPLDVVVVEEDAGAGPLDVVVVDAAAATILLARKKPKYMVQQYMR